MVPAIAAVIADPPRVDVRVFTRLETVDGVLIVLGVDRATGGAATADVGLPLHEPDTLLVEEVLVAESAHRAEVDDVAGELVVEWMAREDVDLFFTTTGRYHQLCGARNFASEPHAPRAHDAAIDEERDGRADVATAAREGMEIGAALRLAVLEVVVLEQAFARLVADRAVDRMVDEERLLDAGPAVFDQLAFGDDHRAILRRRLAARHQLRHHRDLACGGIAGAGLDQAHPATGHDRQAGMPAIVGNFGAGAASGLDAVEPLVGSDLDFLAVNDDCGHECS